MRLSLYLGLGIVAIPALAVGQSYQNAPFYQLAKQPPAGVIFRWGGRPTEANGISTQIVMSVHPTGGWEEGMRVDGQPGAQVLHWYAAFYKPHATFGYNLLLEPIPGSTRIRCTFSTMTEPEGGFGLRDTSSSLVQLPEPLTPLIVESGDTVSVSFLPEPTLEKTFVQSLTITLKPRTKDGNTEPSTPLP